MGRIRSIKPEFNANEGLSSLSAQAHLLAEALLCYADDEGYFNANPVLVRAGTCPLRKDFKNISKYLKELASIGYLRFGSYNGKRYGQVIHFKNHQKISHPTKSKFNVSLILWEGTPEVFGESPELLVKDPESLGEVTEPLRPDQGTGNREQGTGNRGADSGETLESADAPGDSLSPQDRWKKRTMQQRVNEPLSDEAQMIATAVIEAIGMTTEWARNQIARQAEQELKTYPGDLDGIRDGMVAAWKEYCRLDTAGKLSKVACGPEKFYGEGRWRTSKRWGLKPGVRAYEVLSVA
jgi:hypothetical protein